MDEMKWVRGSSHQLVSTVYRISFKSIENVFEIIGTEVLHSHTPVTLTREKGQFG